KRPTRYAHFALAIAAAVLGFVAGRLSVPERELARAPASTSPASQPTSLPAAPAVKTALASRLEAAALVEHGDAFALSENGKLTLNWQRSAKAAVDLGRMTPTVAAFAVGRLLQTGAIKSLSEPIASYFPEWRQGKKRAITLRHVLEHTTGM